MLLILSTLFTLINAISFDIPVNDYRCISEEAFEGQVIHGTYSIPDDINLSGRSITFKIFGEQGTELFVDELKDTQRKNSFAFTPDEESVIDFCFVDKSINRHINKIRVSLDVHTGFQTKTSTANLATKDTVTNIEETVDQAFKSANYIVEYIQECQKMEYKRRDTNEMINSLTMWFSIGIMAIVVALTFIQVKWLKAFFLRRKLI